MSSKKASKRKMTTESSTMEEPKTDLSLVSTDIDGEKPKKVQAPSEQLLENLMPTDPEQGEAQVNEEQVIKEQAMKTMRSADDAEITEPERSMQIAAAGPGPNVQGADGGEAGSSSHSQPLYPDTWPRTPARPATARQDPPSTGKDPDSAHNLCDGQEGALWAATVAANPDLQNLVRTRRSALEPFYAMIGYIPPPLPEDGSA